MLESRIPTASVGGVLEQAIGNGVAGLVVFELNKGSTAVAVARGQERTRETTSGMVSR